MSRCLPRRSCEPEAHGAWPGPGPRSELCCAGCLVTLPCGLFLCRCGVSVFTRELVRGSAREMTDSAPCQML